MEMGGTQDLGTPCSGLHSLGPCQASPAERKGVSAAPAQLASLGPCTHEPETVCTHPAPRESSGPSGRCSPGGACASRGSPRVLSAARSSAQHEPCRMGPGERKGCPRPAPNQHPLNRATTWDFLFFFLREEVEFLQKAETSPVAPVPVLAGAMFGAIHHRWKVPNDILP